MNVLVRAIQQSLAELDLGLKGDLTMSESMEKLLSALATDSIPKTWAALAYPSLRPLASWLLNLNSRITQLIEWTTGLLPPKSVWLSGGSRYCTTSSQISTNWDSRHEKGRTHCYVLPCTASCHCHGGFYNADATVSIPLHL